MFTKLNTKKSFTLIELVMVMTLIAILTATSVQFMTFPIKAYLNIVDRAEIVNSAEVLFSRISRDLKNAVPNSVRVKPGDPKALEFINIIRGFRYRSTGPDDDALIIGENDNQFNVFETFDADMLGTQGYRVIVYNLGAEGANSDDPIAGQNAYSPDNHVSGGGIPSNSHIITPGSIQATLSNSGNEGKISLNNNMKFGFSSQNKRLYLTNTPISYICDTTAGTITRYAGYSIQRIQPNNPSVAPLSTASKKDIIAENVTSCSFSYNRNVTANAGIVRINLEFTRNGRKIQLFDQAQVSNAP